MSKAIVVEHDPNWKEQFAVESYIAAAALELDAIHHIGSTSIPGIYAKPIIDMLGEASDLARIDQLNVELEKLGYETMGEFGIAGRRYFRKDVEGIRRFHLHVFETGSDEAVRHLRFRDYLIGHPEKALEYSTLKEKLIIDFQGDMEKYIEGKDPLIREIDRLAGTFTTDH